MDGPKSAISSSESQKRGGWPSKSSFPLLRSTSLNSVRLRRIFDIFDKDKDSIISAEELTEALNLLGLHTHLCDLDSTLRIFQLPAAGLTFQDFEVLHRSLLNNHKAHEPPLVESDSESDLWEAFKVFDEDGDGHISARELQVVLHKLGLQEEIDRVQLMISTVDLNHDGLVDFLEFKTMMRPRSSMLHLLLLPKSY